MEAWTITRKKLFREKGEREMYRDREKLERQRDGSIEIERSGKWTAVEK